MWMRHDTKESIFFSLQKYLSGALFVQGICQNIEVLKNQHEGSSRVHTKTFRCGVRSDNMSCRRYADANFSLFHALVCYSTQRGKSL